MNLIINSMNLIISLGLQNFLTLIHIHENTKANAPLEVAPITDGVLFLQGWQRKTVCYAPGFPNNKENCALRVKAPNSLHQLRKRRQIGPPRCCSYKKGRWLLTEWQSPHDISKHMSFTCLMASGSRYYLQCGSIQTFESQLV